ncbi:MAG: antitoxin [Intrasporangium sp.]|uniref:antitoxin n=1 Tax=Intrasporangium sp. TaxID=1925024 RepID=UPI002648341C|nr:antitoxin [Intrasporangium sp.]MDN5798269.1 antitoxin [Intrasporangium sp.]
MSFADKVKHRAEELEQQARAKAEELELKDKANQFAGQAKDAAHQAKGKVGELAHENREKIEGFVENAGRWVDEHTGGKYTDTITKAREQVARGVDKVADSRPVEDVPGPEAREAAPDVTTTDVTGAAGPGSSSEAAGDDSAAADGPELSVVTEEPK